MYDVAELDPQTAAFHRLLTDAHSAPQAKVDALVALVMRTVYVVPWPGGVAGYRTLVNSDGVAALPIFTTPGCLEEAARRYGWVEPDGSIPQAEIGARAAFNYAFGENVAFVVIDIAEDHALEVTKEEVEPLLTPAARRESSGPYSAAGKISSSLIRAVKSTPPPMKAVDGQMHPTPVPGSLQAAQPRIEPPKSTPGVEPSPSGGPPSAAGPSLAYGAPPSDLDDEVYASLQAALRDYPEVEWAALMTAAPQGGGPSLCAGVRIDASFRKRVDEIADAVRAAAADHGVLLEVLLLDAPEATRGAREAGEVFYPWRKK